MAGTRSPGSTAVPKELQRFRGKTFAVAGKLSEWECDHVAKIIKGDGGRLVEQINPSLDFLILAPPKKLTELTRKLAERLNRTQEAAIQVLDLQAFFDLACPDRELTLALLHGGESGGRRLGLLRHRSRLPVDLQGSDLRKVQLGQGRLDLTGLNLNGADLGQANLSWCRVDPLSDACLDGAMLQHLELKRVTRCSLREADLTYADWIRAVLDDCDLTGACLEHANFYSVRASNLVLRSAKAPRLYLREARLTGLDAGKGQFQHACFMDSNLAGATFAGADLSDADLTRANLRGADLRNANLRGACLMDADLSEAQLDGTNFEGANVSGAQLDGTAPERARGLNPADTVVPKRTGPNLKKLDQLACQCDSFTVQAVLDLPGEGRVSLEAKSYGRGKIWYAHADCSTPYTPYPSRKTRLETILPDLMRRWPTATLQLDSIKARASAGSPSGKELVALVRAAFCEACGLPVPTGEELKEWRKQMRSAQKQRREELLANLRSGPKGVERWNAVTQNERMQAGPYRKVALGGAQLDRADLKQMDFQEANFAGASLIKADLYGGTFQNASFQGANSGQAKLTQGKFSSANFEGARLLRASLHFASLKQANLRSANLTRARCHSTDLCGADLTGAVLTRADLSNAAFDEQTRFPAGFAIPANLYWAGTGADPRTPAESEPPGETLDLSTFLERLRKSIDPSRLQKALAMLKAERFQLFSQVDDKALVGVVKSQTNPGLVYSCRLGGDGSFSCCTQNLNACGGLRERLCKHLLVLIVGLAKSSQVNPGTIDRWAQASRKKRPSLDKEAASAVFLRYKGAEAGEVDWRPTETIPEDFYAF